MEVVGVVDSSPLIVFGRTGNLHLLSSLFARLVAPFEVRDEVHDFPFGIVQVRAVTNPALLAKLSEEVDRGEAAAIALARETPNGVIILDDRKGRRVASQMGLQVIGSLGVVLLCKQAGTIAAVRPIIKSLTQAGLFLSKGLVERALAEAGE